MERLTIPTDKGPDLEITGEQVARWKPDGLDAWKLPALELYRVASGGYVVAREYPEGSVPRFEADHLADETELVEHFTGPDGVVAREGKSLLIAAGLNRLPGVVDKL